jgi:hypothetical protein
MCGQTAPNCDPHQVTCADTLLACRDHPTRGRNIPPLIFTDNECLDLGTALGPPTLRDSFQQEAFRYNGTIEKVQVQYVK